MKRSGYDFKKVFFKRPIWTEDAVLFGKILTITAILLLTITGIYVSFYLGTPSGSMSMKVKKKYIARLAEIAKDQPVMFASSTNEPEALITVLPEDAREPDVAAPTVMPEKIRAQKSRVVPRPVQLEIEPEEIPRPEMPAWTAAAKSMENYRNQRRTYEKNIRQLNRAKKEITIPDSKFTDFEIISGIRDDEETLAIASENRKLLQHCIDRVHRLHGSARGNIVVKFDIHPEGYAIPESVRIIEADVPDPQILQCVKRSIKRWRNFPRVAYELGVYSLTQKYIF